MMSYENDPKSQTASSVHTYSWRNLNVAAPNGSAESSNPNHLGDVVVVKLLMLDAIQG